LVPIGWSLRFLRSLTFVALAGNPAKVVTFILKFGTEATSLDLERPSRLSRLNGGDSQVDKIHRFLNTRIKRKHIFSSRVNSSKLTKFCLRWPTGFWLSHRSLLCVIKT